MPEEKKIYYDTLKENLTGVSPQNAASSDNGDGGTGETDYYENLKNESYKAMLKKEVQANIAADQARKYTNNALVASGLNTQGYAESTGLGIGNTLRRSLFDAQNEYDNSVKDINLQQQEAINNEANNDFQTITSLMSGAQNQEQLEMIMDNYFPMVDGKRDFSSLDDKSAKQMQILYNLYTDELNSGGIGSTFDPSAERQLVYNGNDYKYIKTGHFDYETDALQMAIDTGELKRGDYVQLHNEEGQDIYLVYGNDGQIHYVSKENYEKANKKYHIYGTKQKLVAGAYKA